MSDSGEKLYLALAETVVVASEEEIFDEAGADGWKKAEQVRHHLLSGVTGFEQRKLQEAFAEYREQVAKFSQHRTALPREAEARRALLDQVFQRLSREQQSALTLQHRGFKNLSDEDVSSCLAQLEALGALESDGEDEPS